MSQFPDESPSAWREPICPSGARRLTLDMRVRLDQADAFNGLPRGTAKPLRLLAAFQEAEPYLGLPVHAYKLVAWLVKQTQPQDWEEGSRPIAWPSARHQAEFLGLSLARVKQLNRALFEAGVFVIRDNEQGKRYGRRDPETKRIIEAFGFDLSPLALRYDEFVRIATAARIERDRMKGLRRRALSPPCHSPSRRGARRAGMRAGGLAVDRGGSCCTGARLSACQPVGRACGHRWRPGAAETSGRAVGPRPHQTSGNKPRGASQRAPAIYIYNPNALS